MPPTTSPSWHSAHNLPREEVDLDPNDDFKPKSVLFEVFISAGTVFLLLYILATIAFANYQSERARLRHYHPFSRDPRRPNPRWLRNVEITCYCVLAPLWPLLGPFYLVRRIYRLVRDRINESPEDRMRRHAWVGWRPERPRSSGSRSPEQDVGGEPSDGQLVERPAAAYTRADEDRGSEEVEGEVVMMYKLPGGKVVTKVLPKDDGWKGGN